MFIKKPRKKGAPVRRRSMGRKRVCRFCTDKIKLIDYKDAVILEKLTTERGKILPRRLSGTCSKHQRLLASAIKKARFIALMPYIAGYK